MWASIKEELNLVLKKINKIQLTLDNPVHLVPLILKICSRMNWHLFITYVIFMHNKNKNFEVWNIFCY